MNLVNISMPYVTLINKIVYTILYSTYICEKRVSVQTQM